MAKINTRYRFSYVSRSVIIIVNFDSCAYSKRVVIDKIYIFFS